LIYMQVFSLLFVFAKSSGWNVNFTLCIQLGWSTDLSFISLYISLQ
jgi:hypothetical protein